MAATLAAVAAPVTSATRPARVVVAVVVAAVVLQLVLLFVAPLLSTDTFRYIHEGRVQRLGLALPYTTAPAQWLAAPPPPDDGATGRVEHVDVVAAYPPGSELLLLSTVALGDALGAPLAPFRIVVVVGVFAFVIWLWRRGRFGVACLVVSSPLVIVEVALEAHLDSCAVPLVAAVVVGGVAVAGIGLGLLLHVKPVALLLLPLVPARARVVAVVVAVVVGVPHALAGVTVPPGMLSYGERWRAHPLGFALVEAPLVAVSDAVVARVGYTHVHVGRGGFVVETAGREFVSVGSIDDGARKVLVDGGFAARVVVGFAIVVVVGVVARRMRRGLLDRASAVGLVVFAWLLATPTVHPWYGLWLLAPAALTTSPRLSRGWFAFAALLPLLHQSDLSRVVTGTWHEALWPRVVIVVGAAIAAATAPKSANQEIVKAPETSE